MSIILPSNDFSGADTRAPESRSGIRPGRAWLSEAANGLWVVVRSLLLPAAIVVLWHLSSTLGWTSSLILPPPKVVWEQLVAIALNGDLWLHTRSSLLRLLVSFLIGAGGGMLIGMAMGLSRTLEDLLSVPFHIINQVPTLGWLPVLIILVGVNERLAWLLIGQAIFVAVAINVYRGFQAVPLAQIEVARVYRMDFFQTLFKVAVPSVLPQIFVGLRTGLAAGWVALVIVELLACSEGLGYLMSQGRALFQLDLVLAIILVVGIIGWLLDALLARLDRLLRRWQPESPREG